MKMWWFFLKEKQKTLMMRVNVSNVNFPYDVPDLTKKEIYFKYVYIIRLVQTC